MRKPAARPAPPPGEKTYELYLGYACNRACRFCFVEGHDKASFRSPIPYADLCRRLYAAYAGGARSISLLGGEPTVNPDLPRVVRFAKKTGYKMVLLFSNGIKLADRDYAQGLAAAGVDAVNLNIPSHEPEVFGHLTGSRGGFRLLEKALANLAGLSVPALAVCVVNALNFRKLPAYAGFCAERGIRMITLQHLKFQGNVNPEFRRDNPDIAALGVSMAACAPFIKKMTLRCLELGTYPPFVEHMTPCALGGFESRLIDFGQDDSMAADYICLHPDGKEAPTWDVSYKDRVKVPACAGCAWDARCYGAEKNYLAVFGPGELKAVRRPSKPFYSGLRGRALALARASYGEAMAAALSDGRRKKTREAA